MLFLILPLLLNPFGVIIRWLPALYLAAWPIIIQTLGRDALILQAILLIMFILACDITREMMLRLIGFDLISLPAGVLLLSLLLTDKGSSMLSIITPICSTLLVAIEPVFLFIESIIVLEMIKAFNKWMGTWSNMREDDSHDLASWEPPLSRGSIFMRFVVILITIASYISTYLLVQEAKILLNFENKDVPIQFNHAIALLVTLQLIAFTATIYKEEGILSESAMIAFTASVPIFIAAWSYNHLKAEADLR